MYHFIMNPKASSGKGMKAWATIEKILKEENVAYQAHVLNSAQETREFVHTLTGGIQEQSDCNLVVLGGDGTINTVLNGIVDFEHTTLSCIRTGSGNDFARNVGVEKNVKKALYHLLHTPEMMCFDYGEATYRIDDVDETRRFAISNGVGYDADICDEVSHSKWKHILNHVGLGKLVYVTVGIKQIFTRKNSGATICMDGEETQLPGLFFVVGMIHEKEGGGVPFCPQADASDGLLEVCLVKPMPRVKLLLAVAMVYMKQHYRFRDITAHKCKNLKVKLDTPQWFHMDGETSKKITMISMTCKSGLRFMK